MKTSVCFPNHCGPVNSFSREQEDEKCIFLPVLFKICRADREENFHLPEKSFTSFCGAVKFSGSAMPNSAGLGWQRMNIVGEIFFNGVRFIQLILKFLLYLGLMSKCCPQNKNSGGLFNGGAYTLLPKKLK